MLFKTQSAALFGIDAYIVEVEVDLAQGGMGTFTTVGLPDTAVKESRQRPRRHSCGGRSGGEADGHGHGGWSG